MKNGLFLKELVEEKGRITDLRKIGGAVEGVGNVLYSTDVLLNAILSGKRLYTNEYETDKKLKIPGTDVEYNPEKVQDWARVAQGAALAATKGDLPKAIPGMMPFMAAFQAIETQKSGEKAADEWKTAYAAYQQNNQDALKKLVPVAWENTKNAFESGMLSGAALSHTPVIRNLFSTLPGSVVFGRDMTQGGTKQLVQTVTDGKPWDLEKGWEAAQGAGQVGFGVMMKHQAGKEAAELAAKAAAKTGAKKIPGLAWIPGLAFGAMRLGDAAVSAWEGDWTGALQDVGAAGGEVASGVMGSIPGPGTAGSIATDVGLGTYDWYRQQRKEKQKQESPYKKAVFESTVRNVLNKNIFGR